MRHHPCAYMNGNPAEVFTDHLAFADVDANADLDVQALEDICNCLAAKDCASLRVKGRQKTIACGFDFSATVTLNLPAHQEVVLTEKFFPRTITQLRRSLC